MQEESKAEARGIGHAWRYLRTDQASNGRRTAEGMSLARMFPDTGREGMRGPEAETSTTVAYISE